MNDEISSIATRGYVDCHVHANACSDEGFNLDKLSAWMDANNVDRCILQQLRRTLPQNAEEEETLVHNFRKFPGRIFGFCVIFAADVTNLDDVVISLQQRKSEGAIGFGEHYGEGLEINDPKCMVLYRACAQVGLPVLLHMDGNNNQDQEGLPLLEKALKEVPDCTFIAHAPGWWRQISNGTCDRLLQAYPNLYGDLSAGSGARAIGNDRQFGREFLMRNADKLLFGTDIGEWTTEDNPPPQFALFDELALPDDTKNRIFRMNAERLFDFD
jgi:predicted TIM-barrel fold metal-dependent hydrolase